MQERFDVTLNPARIVFGDGALDRIPECLDTLGCKNALVLSTPHQQAQAQDLLDRLGSLGAGLYAKAAMHTPVDITEDALQVFQASRADCTLAIGGGSTTGLGKALALRTDCPQIAIPTTYAGSEVTPILGQTENGVKTTITSPKVLPEIVVYDPVLTHGLPVPMTITSALNALAHAAEALYAQNRNPIATLMAGEGARALIEALPAIIADPGSAEGRRKALYGAWLCGTVLSSVGMALHHKLCHTLGGAFDLPHAETHAIVLPHALAFNEVAVPDLLKPVAEALSSETAGGGLHTYAKSLSAPTALKEIGMPEDGIDRAADLATQNPYWNPRPFDRHQIRTLIENAFHGHAPEPVVS